MALSVSSQRDSLTPCSRAPRIHCATRIELSVAPPCGQSSAHAHYLSDCNIGSQRRQVPLEASLRCPHGPRFLCALVDVLPLPLEEGLLLARAEVSQCAVDDALL